MGHRKAVQGKIIHIMSTALQKGSYRSYESTKLDTLDLEDALLFGWNELPLMLKWQIRNGSFGGVSTR